MTHDELKARKWTPGSHHSLMYEIGYDVALQDSAAHDMYEALESLIEACEALGVTGPNLDAARSALRKADGKE